MEGNIFLLIFITRKSRESSHNGGRIQAAREMEDLKTSKHLQALSEENGCIKDYIHKMTRYITNYCIKNDIHTVVINGGYKGICKESETWGVKTNQKLHSLPYAQHLYAVRI